jgi:DNA polymerase/3'-5' exonuclease PolX
MTDFKQTIIAELEVLRRVSAKEAGGTFKVRNYAAAIKKLAELPGVWTAADAAGIGGEKIQEKIAAIIGGSFVMSDAVRAKAAALDAFQKIYGVGPAVAEKLVAAGYTSIADLRAAVATGYKLTANQQIGLRYYEDLLERIPRAEMEAHAALLLGAVAAVGMTGEIVGSYRRGAASSGDIDMLVTGGALEPLVARLKAAGYIKEVLAMGEHKCLAISAVAGGRARRLDLLVTPAEELPFALVYFTGSMELNVAMRSRALERGYTLNEHALTRVKTGARITGITSEKELFKVLGFDWKEPSER